MLKTRWWISIIVSFSIQSYVLYYAFHYGTLVGLVQWDDCQIILRGLENLDRLAQGRSVFDLIRITHRLDIHAPLSDIQTIFGLLLSGGRTWGPYLLNAVWLTLVLEAILRTYDRRTRAFAATMALFLLVQALTINALEDVKSDWSGGLLLAGSLFLLAQGAQRQQPEWKSWGAVLLGLSTLSKLTAFYLPVVAAIILLLFEWYSAVLSLWSQIPETSPADRRIPGVKAVLRTIDPRSLALRLVIGAGPFAIFFLFEFKSILSYIRVSIGPAWADGLTALARVRFYGPLAPDSQTQWGSLHLFFPPLLAASLLLAWRRRNRSHPIVLLIHALVGLTIFLPLIFSNSNHSFESTFLGVVMAATMISMDYVMRSLPGRGGLAVCAAVVLLALPAALPLRNSAYYSRFPVSNAELRQLADTYGNIVELMIRRADGDSARVAVFYDHLFAPHPNLAIEYFRKTGHLLAVTRVDDLSDVGQIGPLSRIDFVLTIVPAPGQALRLIPGIYPNWPISHDPRQADDMIRKAGEFDLLGVFGVRGGEIHLYANRQYQAR